MAKESRESSGQGIEERGTAGTVGTVNSGKFSRTMKHKKSIQILLTLLTLPYKKDKNSINSASFIEQLKGAQVHANDLPHSLEVPAADTHEDHRALPQVLEEKVSHVYREFLVILLF